HNTKSASGEQRRSDCPIACTLDIVGDRWSLLVIRDLARGKQHFDELLESPEGIASNILSDRLRTLTRHGLVKREKCETDGRRLVYRLSKAGWDFADSLTAIASWGLRNLEKTAAFPDIRR
ncbi:MAG: helix-turn-helix domain-containing protein, partial [Planctomycetota bacterium]